jgi:hypothetical protein
MSPVLQRPHSRLAALHRYRVSCRRTGADLVERTVVSGIESACGAMGGHARIAGGAIDVKLAARSCWGWLLRIRQGSGGHRERQCEHNGETDSRFHVGPR